MNWAWERFAAGAPRVLHSRLSLGHPSWVHAVQPAAMPTTFCSLPRHSFSARDGTNSFPKTGHGLRRIFGMVAPALQARTPGVGFASWVHLH